jgi:hypothetical protein
MLQGIEGELLVAHKKKLLQDKNRGKNKKPAPPCGDAGFSERTEN